MAQSVTLDLREAALLERHGLLLPGYHEDQRRMGCEHCSTKLGRTCWLCRDYANGTAYNSRNLPPGQRKVWDSSQNRYRIVAIRDLA